MDSLSLDQIELLVQQNVAIVQDTTQTIDTRLAAILTILQTKGINLGA